MKKIIHKYGQWIGKNMSQLEWMVIFWIGIPLYLIAVSLVMILVALKDSMCF